VNISPLLLKDEETIHRKGIIAAAQQTMINM
jgi:hypothetical protein